MMVLHMSSQGARRWLRLARQVVLAGAAVLAVSPMAAAQPVAMPDFTQIVERVDPAVVHIRTTATVPTGGRRGGPVGPGGPGGDPYELFRWFFGPDFVPPGQAQPQPRSPAPGAAPGAEERRVPRGVGSGFFISADGYILTNHHVIEGADGIQVTLMDGREIDAKVVGSDQRTDVALLKVDLEGAATLPIGNPDQLRKGEWVLAFGSPFGLEATVTSGIISAVGRDTGEYLPFIQTDVAVNPGNSGGPLVNLKGEVVGINSQIVSRSGGFMGISLAIPIDDAMVVVDQLREKGRVTRGRIGVQIGPVSDDVAKAIGLAKPEGAMVSGVERDGPADKAGVQPGDVITRFNGEAVTRVSDLPRLVGNTAPGTEASLQVWRRGKSVDLKVKVDEMPSEAPRAAAGGAKPVEPEAPKVNELGLAVSNLSADERRELRVDGGVRVDHVDGPAATAGIQVGDILLVLDDTEITSARQFNDLVAGLKGDRSHALLVRRDDLTQWVPIRLAR